MAYHFSRKAYRPVTMGDMNKIIVSIKAKAGKFYMNEYNKDIHGGIKNNAFVEDGLRFLKITCSYKGKVASYVMDKTTGRKEDAVQGCNIGAAAWMCLCKMCGKENIHRVVQYEDFDEDGKCRVPFSASPFIWYSEEYNGTEQEAIDYDMNSAYAYAMLGDMPDTRNVNKANLPCYNQGIVHKNEIGFDTLGNLVEEGCFATYRFAAMKSPFKKFVAYYYKLKTSAKNKEARKHAKDVLNMSVGYLQRINPFLRATIVSRANNLIKSLMDEDTIYCNTDSIVSLRKRDDLKLGSNVGEWKIENKGKFRYRGNNYQWNDEVPSYRGIPKCWFPKDYNILTDDVPPNMNIYELDPLNMKVRRK